MTGPPRPRGPEAAVSDLATRLDALLPQTQCTRCGYPACRPYAEAIAAGEADIDRCPPGGDAGAAALASASGRPVRPVDRSRGEPGPLRIALIDEAACIGCTICLQKCPVDAIVGAARRMHTVIAAECTGCELCVEPCPVDCIALVEPAPGSTRFDPRIARERHRFREQRLAREPVDRAQRHARAAALKLAALEQSPPGGDEAAAARRRAIVERALARARARLAGEEPDRGL